MPDPQQPFVPPQPANPVPPPTEREPDVGTGATKPAPAVEKEPKGGQQYYELEQPRPMPEPDKPAAKP